MRTKRVTDEFHRLREHLMFLQDCKNTLKQKRQMKNVKQRQTYEEVRKNLWPRLVIANAGIEVSRVPSDMPRDPRSRVPSRVVIRDHRSAICRNKTSRLFRATFSWLS